MSTQDLEVAKQGPETGPSVAKQVIVPVAVAEGMHPCLHIASKATAGFSLSSERNVFHTDKIHTDKSITPPFKKNDCLALNHFV